MSAKLFLDMDGVVADFIGGASKLHGIDNPHEDENAIRGDEAWSLITSGFGDPAHFWAPMGRSFWANLPLTAEAPMIIDIIQGTVGMDNTCFLTTPCLTEGCIEGKRDWVKKHFPGMPILASIAGSRSHMGPKEFCAGPHSILIDDHTPNIEQWTKRGGVGYVFPRSWNVRYRDVGIINWESELHGLLSSVQQRVAGLQVH